MPWPWRREQKNCARWNAGVERRSRSRMPSPPPLLEVLNKAAAYLQAKGVPQPRLDAELLLARALGLKRLDLYLQFDRPLTEPELAGYRDFIRRRGGREPLQHILGDVEFRQLTLRVDRRALIPRPETEVLLDVFGRHLPARPQPRVLDVGVGSGCIALSILREWPHCEVTALDVSEDCLTLTRENAARNGLALPELFRSDLFAGLPPDRVWDAVVSNPPYVAAREIPMLEPEVRNYDPVQALNGGEGGWEFPLALLHAAFSRVADGGIFLMEIDPPQFDLLKTKASEIGWTNITGHVDFEQKIRFLLAHQAMPLIPIPA